MISVTSFNGRDITGILTLVGLSTDTKPTVTTGDYRILNGSSFFEMDTGNTFMYSESNETWYSI